MRVIGVDPGLRAMGWGVIEVEGSRMRHLGHGQITTNSKATLADRLVDLHGQLSAVLIRFAPTAGALEQTFVNKDGHGTLKLGQARGVALLALAQTGLEVGEYAPNTVKKTVVGVGHAQKGQVQHMVSLQFPGLKLAGPDAADALAIALCHAHHAGSAARYGAALAKAVAQ